MKKIFALLLVALMLLPCIVSCSGGGGGTVINNDDEDYTLPVGSINSRDEFEKEDAERTKEWDGKTLNILATTWDTAEPGAPWSTAELTITAENYKKYMSYTKEQLDAEAALDTGFGREINTAMIKRQKLIKDVYGVDVLWTNSKGTMVSNIITENLANPAGERYHIAMVRALEAQTLVGNKVLFNLANSPSIDLSKSYFNQVALESYSVAGNTYFVAGDFSFLDEQTSYLIFLNLGLVKSSTIPNLYQKVRDGKWTIDEMLSIARNPAFFGDIDKTTGYQDTDKYGFGTTNLSRFFQSSGIQQVSVDETTGLYQISLNDGKVGTLVDKLIDISKASYARTKWDGGYGALGEAFGDDRLLFYNEVVQKFDIFGPQSEKYADLQIGTLPSPKLNEDQESYYTPCSYQSTLMCIPKTTPSKRMSTYFFDVISWTGQEYLMGYSYDENGEKVYTYTEDEDGNVKDPGYGYYSYLRAKVKDYKEPGDTMEMITDYIFAGLCYDVGYMHSWDGLLSSVQGDSYSGDENKFQTAYEGAYETALAIVEEWNTNWRG